jgi:hypothetical protein
MFVGELLKLVIISIYHCPVMALGIVTVSVAMGEYEQSILDTPEKTWVHIDASSANGPQRMKSISTKAELESVKMILPELAIFKKYHAGFGCVRRHP